ncbi:MAG: hypothetical protein IJF73_00610 [Clostridia bacterium]|nr:hypothetical protein [Clostridia bacterium]
MSRDLFTLAAEGSDRASMAARRTLAEHTGGILLVFCLLLTAAIPLVLLELVNPFSPEFFMRTAYTGLSSYLAYLLFLPEGKRSAALTEGEYRRSGERLAALSEVVRGGHLTAFFDFCQRAAEREAERHREALLALSRAEGLSPRRKKRAERRAARVRAVPISPARILCGEGRGEVNDVGRRHLSYGARSALARPLLILGTAILFSSVNFLPGATPDAATAVRILSGIFGVTMAAFAGYAAGCGEIRYQTADRRRRILFLSSFFEEAGLTAE